MQGKSDVASIESKTYLLLTLLERNFGLKHDLAFHFALLCQLPVIVLRRGIHAWVDLLQGEDSMMSLVHEAGIDVMDFGERAKIILYTSDLKAAIKS